MAPAADRTRPVPAARPRAPGSRATLPLLLAALLGGAALGGCDGGIFGTGGDDGVLDGGISGTGADLGQVPVPSGTQDGALDGPDDISDADATEGPPAVPFDNDLPTLGFRPLLRGVNLAGTPIEIVVEGLTLPGIAPGDVGEAAVLADQASDVSVVDAASGEVLGRLDARLAPGSLTTLVVHAGSSGTPVVVPLETRARTDDDAVALVRVAYAIDPRDAAAQVGTLLLSPAGDDPGGSEARFVAAAEGSIESEYASVDAGTYALSADGGDAALPVDLAGGEVYTLMFFPDPGAAGGTGFLSVRDSDVP